MLIYQRVVAVESHRMCRAGDRLGHEVWARPAANQSGRCAEDESQLGGMGELSQFLYVIPCGKLT